MLGCELAEVMSVVAIADAGLPAEHLDANDELRAGPGA